MVLQIDELCAFVVTLGAAKWFITSVNFLMGLQIALLCECSLTIAARVYCGIYHLHFFPMDKNSIFVVLVKLAKTI